MYSKKMYKRLVFYMEACESGSMFEKTLPKDINIYAMTAANAKESSWGTYCPPHGDKVRGKAMGTCLGDLFSINWMQESDSEHKNSNFGRNITLAKQYRYVKRTTNKSHVMLYGDKTFMREDIDAFQGDENDSRLMKETEINLPDESNLRLELISAVDSRDIRLHVLYQRYIRADSKDKASAREELNVELALRDRYDAVFEQFQQSLDLPIDSEFQLTDHWTCYGNIIDYFAETCKKPDEHDYVMKYYGLLYQACASESESKLEELLKALCQEN